MCRDATWQNLKLSKCVDLRAVMDSWRDWSSRMAARLNLWTITFKVMDWLMKPGKYPNWKTKSATISTHNVLWMDLCDPTTHADWEKNSQIAPAALGLSRMGPAAKIAGSGLVTNGCHIFLGISDGDIPVMVRRNSNSDTRTNWFASLNTRDEHVFGITGTDYQWATRPRTNRALRKNPSFGGARAYKLCKTFKKDGLNTRNIGILATKTAISKLPVVDQLRMMQVCRAHVKKKHWQLDDVKRLLPGRFQMLPQVHPNNRKKKLVGGFNLPLWKMMEFVNGKDYISHIWNGK